MTVRINIASFIDEWKLNNDAIKRHEQRIKTRWEKKKIRS